MHEDRPALAEADAATEACDPCPDPAAPYLAGIARVAREHLDYDGPISLDLALVDALRLDSLRLLTLVVELENHFEVCLDEGDESGIQTVSDLVALLRRAGA